MCVVRLFPWWKFTDVCEGDIRKPCYSESEVRQGCEPLLLRMPLTEFPLKSGIAGVAGEEAGAEQLASGRLSAWLRDVRQEGRLHRAGGEGGAQEETSSGLPAPAKVETKPKTVAGKDTSLDKKVQTKGEKGRKGETGWSGKKLKKTYLQKTEKLKTEESPASDEAGKKPNMLNITPNPIRGPVSLFV